MSTAKGVKLDTGKLRWELLPLRLVIGIVRVLTFGAIKYTDNGWQTVDNAKERYYAALMRHLYEYRNGNVVDQESGLNHLDHALTNLAFLKHFELEEESCKKQSISQSLKTKIKKK